MTLEEFERSAKADPAPPPDLSLPLQALWHDIQGDWHVSHEKAQADAGRDGAWVHAYLHRKEGDAGNAAYWYARAGKPTGKGSLDDERRAIIRFLLGSLNR